MNFTIDPLVVCENDGNQPPTAFAADANGAFRCPFTAAPPESTGKVWLKVICNFPSGASHQFRYRLLMMPGQPYAFNMGDGAKIDYVRQPTSGQAVYLPFDLRCLRAAQATGSATLKLEARHDDQEGTVLHIQLIGVRSI